MICFVTELGPGSRVGRANEDRPRASYPQSTRWQKKTLDKPLTRGIIYLECRFQTITRPSSGLGDLGSPTHATPSRGRPEQPGPPGTTRDHPPRPPRITQKTPQDQRRSARISEDQRSSHKKTTHRSQAMPDSRPPHTPAIPHHSEYVPLSAPSLRLQLAWLFAPPPNPPSAPKPSTGSRSQGSIGQNRRRATEETAPALTAQRGGRLDCGHGRPRRGLNGYKR